MIYINDVAVNVIKFNGGEIQVNINNIRQRYDFLNHYQPASFLRKQIMQCNKLNIYLYLQARRTYHLLRKWLK